MQPVSDECTVSVLMPVFNGRVHLGSAIESVQAQSMPSFELIVVDDGSSDGCQELAASYAARDPRIRVMRQSNAGQGFARSKALRHATGRFVVFLDADDVLYPDFLCRAIAFLDSRPDVDIVHTSWEWIECPDAPRRPAIKAPSPADYLTELLLGNLFVIHACVSRRDSLARVGDMHSIKTEDWEYWARCALMGLRFDRLPEVLVATRETEGSDRKHEGSAARRFEEACDAIFSNPLAGPYRQIEPVTRVRLRVGAYADQLSWGQGEGASRSLSAAVSAIPGLREAPSELVPRSWDFLPAMPVTDFVRLQRALCASGLRQESSRVFRRWARARTNASLLASSALATTRGSLQHAERHVRRSAHRARPYWNALSSRPPALSAEMTITEILERSLAFVESQRIAPRGQKFLGYRFSPDTTVPVVHAAVAAILLRDLVGQEAPDEDEQIEYVLASQSNDGIFRDPAIASPLAETEDWWGFRHLTLHALMAAAMKDAPLKHELSWVSSCFESRAFAAYLESLDWGDGAAWTSNAVQNLGVALQYARDYQRSDDAAHALDILHRVITEHQDPETGLFGARFDTARQLSLGVQAGYHLWLLQAYDLRETAFAERIVDSVLRIQNPLGGYSSSWHASACEDIDAIDPLLRFRSSAPSQEGAIEDSLLRALSEVLGNLNPDGGWVFARNQSLTYGHSNMFAAPNQSNVFFTWFRVLGLAYCLIALGERCPAELRFPWHIRRIPGHQFV